MKTRLARALAEDVPRVLLLLWGARPQDDPGDPETWKDASPHWSEDRRRMMEAKYEAALAGEVDPEADDPDPMEGFRAQYLNVWPPLNVKPVRGEPVVDRLAWSELVVARPSSTPVAAAIETDFGGEISVALAWRLTDGAALVGVQSFDDLALAGFAVADSGFDGEVDVPAALVDDPALAGLRLRKVTRAGGLPAVLDITRWLADGQIAHDGGDDLTRQILAVRTVPGADGPRLASTGRLDAVKAAAWATTAARSKPVRRPGRVLTATV